MNSDLTPFSDAYTRTRSMDSGSFPVTGRLKPPKLFVFYLGGVTEFTLSGRQEFGRRDEQRKILPALALENRTVSRRHGLFTTAEGKTSFLDLGSSNGTLINGIPAVPNEAAELHDGDILRIHPARNSTRYSDVVMIYSRTYPDSFYWKKLDLTHEPSQITIGRTGSAEMPLSDQRVSHRHALLFRTPDGWGIADQRSRNGVYVNRNRISGPAALEILDVIRIASYYFIYTGSSILYQSDRRGGFAFTGSVPSHAGRFEGRGSRNAAALTVDIRKRTAGGPVFGKVLLENIHFRIPSGNLVLILGGSGAGKTTLINAIMGYEKASGRITFAGRDLYREYESMQYEIGYVPQEDLVRMDDTVFSTLLDAAKMNLPGLTHTEHVRRCNETLTLFGLYNEKHQLVGKLSGGQRKRLNIAVTYIGNPSLFFLDEPDSGLDGANALEVMENLHRIAEEGRIALVISHSPDRAFRYFNKIIVLAKSTNDQVGHLAFYGTPAEALRFFGTENLESIVRLINSQDEGGEGKADYYIQKFESMRAEAENGGNVR